MIETSKAHELDIVELSEDLPNYNLKRCERGTVVEVFDMPEEAYMLEFVSPSGAESRFADWVRPEQIIHVTSLVNEILGKGIALLNDGKIGEAERLLEEAVKILPECKAEIRT